jgi:hypothetical protein
VLARLAGPALAALAVGLTGCKKGPVNETPGAPESPQAKAEPAPLANALVTASALAGVDAGPPPVPLRADLAVNPDTAVKDAVGWEIEAVLRPLDPPPAFRGKETSIEAIDAVKKKTEPRLVIDLGPQRMRIELVGGGFVLPEGTELRSRIDRFGHVVLLGGTTTYRIAAPGALRALLDDRRLDVEPLAPADAAQREDTGRRLGYRTRRIDVANRVGVATFEVAHVAEVGEGGALLCRTLLELMNAPPSTPVCGSDDVPLHVELRWPTKQGVVFDAFSLAHRVDLAASTMAAPPPSASFAPPSIPPLGAEQLVPAADLTAFRSAPADLPPALGVDGGVAAAEPGLALANASDQLRFAWLDGAPVAWVAPGGRLALPTLLRGRYGFAWRTFLADAVEAPITITVPASQIAGGPDGGAP